MAPHLVKWHNEFSEQGLRIIDIDYGLRDSLADVEAHVEQDQIPFAVVHDGAGDLCEAYGIAAFPTAYLIGTDGRVIWEGHPSGADREQIVEALSKVRAQNDE